MKLLLSVTGVALAIIGRASPTPYGVLIELVGIGVFYVSFRRLEAREVRDGLISFFLISIFCSLLAWVSGVP